MRKLRAALVFGLVVPSSVAWVGCGESASDSKPVMVAPDVPPAQAQKDSMDNYLKQHPDAAKKAGPGSRPQ
jgi:hypothetical protein